MFAAAMFASDWRPHCQVLSRPARTALCMPAHATAAGMGSTRVAGPRWQRPSPSNTSSSKTSRDTERATACSAARRSVQAGTVESEGKHAVLHDFCMIIPYSTIVLLAGLGSLFFGTGWRGVALAAAGALELWLTLQSLKLWRAGAEHRTYTAGTAGVALCLSSVFFKSARAGGLWPKVLLGALSIAATVFLIHNVAAGGNPPKGDAAYTTADAMRPHPTAS